MLSTKRLIPFLLCIFLLCLAGCGQPEPYNLRKDIDEITSAEIAICTEESEITVDEILVTLSTEDAQSMAMELETLECEYINPPIHQISGQTIIIYYNDGSREFVTSLSNRYFPGDRQYYGCRVFDYQEFDNLISKYSG